MHYPPSHLLSIYGVQMLGGYQYLQLLVAKKCRVDLFVASNTGLGTDLCVRTPFEDTSKFNIFIYLDFIKVGRILILGNGRR